MGYPTFFYTVEQLAGLEDGLEEMRRDCDDEVDDLHHCGGEDEEYYVCSSDVQHGIVALIVVVS